jgi:large subunit ribosomal protein L25
VSEVRIAAVPRNEFGKGAARRIRRDHRVPAVIHGHGGAPRHISLPAHELMMALKTHNVLLQLSFPDGPDELAIPKDVQRDPVRGTLEHVDLLVVRRGERVKVEVSLHVIGDPVPDTMVVSELNALEVMAEATHIPDFFELDISGRPAGSQVLAKEVVLPAGVELVTDPEHLIVNIVGARSDAEFDASLGDAAPPKAEPADEAE